MVVSAGIQGACYTDILGHVRHTSRYFQEVQRLRWADNSENRNLEARRREKSRSLMGEVLGYEVRVVVAVETSWQRWFNRCNEMNQFNESRRRGLRALQS
jgi:hypothetical protein